MILKDNTILVYKNDNSKVAVKEEDGQEYVPLRTLMSLLPKSEMDRILKEYQEHRWNLRTTYCGVCGALSQYNSDEDCKECPKCSERYYPAQFPAVIVAITKGDKILLAHNTKFTGDMHSVLAGFVNLGENLEECIRREVLEEVGIEIENIEYFGSQSWGFTSSLMLAFKAKYKSGEITVDGVEIDRAGWFSKNNLPELPPAQSIGRLLIDSFVSN